MMEYSKDVQNAVLSFVMGGEETSESSKFVFLCLDNNIDIHDVIIILQHIQNRVENFLISAD